MQCVHHSDRAASALCQRCDKTLCEECIQDRGGRRFCAECADFVDRRSAARPAGAPVPPGPPETAGSAGDLYPGPPPAGDLYPGPTSPGDVDQGPPPAGDLYQDPASTEGDLYPGPDPEGDLYPGPASPGGVYQGPPAGSPAAAQAISAGGDTSFSIRGLLAGVFGVLISAALYYWLFVEVDLRFKLFALVMAFVVSFAARIGAGRPGHDVGIMAAVLFVLSVVFGQYAVERAFHEEMYAAEEIQRQAASDIRIDGRYTDDEARRLMGLLPDEWEEMSAQEKRWSHEGLRAEYEEARAEGWDPRELYAYDEPAGEALETTLTLGAYFKDLFFYLGFWGIFLLAVGSVEAYKIAATAT